MKIIKTFIIYLLFIVIFLSGPIIAQSKIVYRVQKGDNITLIADKFNLTSNEIIKANQISNPDVIRVGQKIQIPGKYFEYKIKAGDTLSKIADKYNVNLQDIIKINKIDNPDKIYRGQKIKIPVKRNTEKRHTLSRYNNLSFIWPVQGKITSPFGWRTHPISHDRQFHTGIDIAVPIGSPVYAAENGIVIYSGYSRGYGNLVIIKHRHNKKTYYAHNIELLVNEGETINKGKVIALSGNSGHSTGPHLHFEIRTNNRVDSPMKYLNKQYLRNGFRI